MRDDYQVERLVKLAAMCALALSAINLFLILEIGILLFKGAGPQ